MHLNNIYNTKTTANFLVEANKINKLNSYNAHLVYQLLSNAIQKNADYGLIIYINYGSEKSIIKDYSVVIYNAYNHQEYKFVFDFKHIIIYKNDKLFYETKNGLSISHILYVIDYLNLAIKTSEKETRKLHKEFEKINLKNIL